MTTIQDLVLSKSIEDGDCLRWTGAKAGNGHPQTRLNGSSVLVRRELLAAEKGEIEMVEGHKKDANAATRRAIVRAAAAIGGAQ